MYFLIKYDKLLNLNLVFSFSSTHVVCYNICMCSVYYAGHYETLEHDVVENLYFELKLKASDTK